MNSRLRNILLKLEKEGLDALLVTHPANISYLTKFPSRDSFFLASKKANLYITDSRYIEEAKLRVQKPVIVKRLDTPLSELIADICLNYGYRRVGFEEGRISFSEHKKIISALGKKTKFIPASSLIEVLREVKEPGEIKEIKKAINITAAAFKFIKGLLSTGKREIELVGELERFIRYRGAGNCAFDIIVASGPNSSYPHHTPSQNRIKANEPVLIDMGVDYRGYKTDLTRVYFLGKINACVRKIYDIVLEAQDRAIRLIKPGVLTGEIDSAARQYITQKGYGGFFGHNLGHGVGLEVHEGPSISSRRSKPLRPGMIFTLEPAIYLPNRFGIRLEDMVLVTRKGCEVLSGAVNK